MNFRSRVACAVLFPTLTAAFASAQAVPPPAAPAAPAAAADKASPDKAPAIAPAAAADPLEQVLPEVSFANVSLENVVEYLQAANKNFRAVVVRRGDGEGPLISMKLRNVSIDQIIDIITAAYPRIELNRVEGATGAVMLLSIAQPKPGEAPGGEIERSVRVYRLAGIVTSVTQAANGGQPKSAKAALDDVLSLIKATLQLAANREPPTLQVHEETQTLIFKGSSQQRLALEDVLTALESPQAVRAGKPDDAAKLQIDALRAEVERAKADTDRTQRRAEEEFAIARKRAETLELTVQELRDQLRERDSMISNLKEAGRGGK